MLFLKYFLAIFGILSLLLLLAWGVAELAIYILSTDYGWIAAVVGIIALFSAVLAAEAVNYNEK